MKQLEVELSYSCAESTSIYQCHNVTTIFLTGSTPLHDAAQDGHEEVVTTVTTLPEHGAEVNTTDKNGKSTVPHVKP